MKTTTNEELLNRINELENNYLQLEIAYYTLRNACLYYSECKELGLISNGIEYNYHGEPSPLGTEAKIAIKEAEESFTPRIF